MEKREFFSILIAIIVLTIVISIKHLFNREFEFVILSFIFSVILISLTVISKKIMAHLLDADVEHELWKWSRFGFKDHHRLKNEISAGIVFPLFFSIISLGYLKILTFLTYETRALKHRAAKRFGIYSFTEMTDWHNALIGSAGIIMIIVISTIAYLTNFEYFAKIATFYAFFSLLPISKFDGTQIFFGSRVIYAVLATITLIYTYYALVI